MIFPLMIELCCQLMVSFCYYLYVSLFFLSRDYIPTSVWHCYGISSFGCGCQPSHGIHRGKGSFYIFISPVFLVLMMFILLSIKIKYWRFLNIMNSIHPSIQFTHETENSNKCLPFLDVLLERNDDSSFYISVSKSISHRQIPRFNFSPSFNAQGISGQITF